MIALDAIGGSAVEDDDRIYGLKSIAAELGISERKLRRLMNPRRLFPIPVRYGARGLYSKRSWLETWDRHYDAPFGAHNDLKID